MALRSIARLAFSRQVAQAIAREPLATLTRAVAVPCAWNLAGRCSSSLAQQSTGSYAAPSSFAFPSPGNGAALDYPVVDISGQSAGSITLPGEVFNAPVRRDILHRVVRWQLAMRQQGTHKTKTRSEVRGGGRKPRPQKGSGRSRQGSIRAGQWRGGGVIHGPVPRSHAHRLPKRVRRLGLTSALSAKAREGRLVIVDSLELPEAKTRVLSETLDALLLDAPRRSVLLGDLDKAGPDGGASLRRAAANLPWVDVVPSPGLNVYSILRRDYLVLTTQAVNAVVERLGRPIRPARA